MKAVEEETYFWKNKQNKWQIFKDKAGAGMRTTACYGQLVPLVSTDPFSSGVKFQLSINKKKRKKSQLYTSRYPNSSIYSNPCFLELMLSAMRDLF